MFSSVRSPMTLVQTGDISPRRYVPWLQFQVKFGSPRKRIALALAGS